MHELEKRLLNAWPRARWQYTRVLVGCSGGADSVALLCGLLRLSNDSSWIDVAHFNHCWRGAASDGDAEFVGNLCQDHGVRLHSIRADGLPNTALRKTEEGARDARYSFFTSAAYSSGARYVATAHTASDRVETMLHNLFRGTGLAGVATPRFTRELDEELVLVRPLLHCPRELVVAYLKEIGQEHRVDASNGDDSFKRNYIRNQLLPVLRQQYGDQVDARLLAFSAIAEETTDVIAEQACDYMAQAARLACEARDTESCPLRNQPAIMIPSTGLLPVSWPVLQHGLVSAWQDRTWPLKPMSRRHWEQVRISHLALGGANRSNYQLPGNLTVTMLRDWLLIYESPSSAQKTLD